jgi:drug/metabolite transporter (DMT)-like permease
MGALLGLASAIAFGISDYVGGLAARRIHFLLVTVVGESVGVVVAWTCLVWFHGDGATAQAVLWGAGSGIGAAVGTIALYRGYGHGEMAVTGPLSAVGAAVVPAIVGISTGDDLPIVGLIGVLLAVPAIWLMSTTQGSEDVASSGGIRIGVVDGLVSGAGFGVLFIGLGLAGDGSGLWPVAAGQTAAVTLVAAVAVSSGVASTARSALRGQPGRLSLIAAALGISATILYFRAAHTSLLTVAAVLTSVYPGVTVALAAILLHERPSRIQWSGLALGAVAVTAIVVG